MATSTKKTEQVNEVKKSNLTQFFALWERKSEKGTLYLTGKHEEVKLVGFYNNKENLRTADITIYKGEVSKMNWFLDLWVNTVKSNPKKRYVSGKLDDGRRVVGFFNEDHTPKQPLISVYIDEKDEE